MNTQTLDLDISKRGYGQVVKVGQGDAGGVTIEANIYDNGVPLALAGFTATFVMLAPDKRHYVRDSGCTVSGTKVTYVVDESKVASVAGYTDEAYFVLAKAGKTYSTERFALDIIRSALDNATPSESWDNAVDKLIKDGQAATDAANKAALSANTAAGAANTATGKANAAAAAANKSAGSANDAAASANASKAAADAATSAANTAAQGANDAKTEALKAAEEARGSISPDKRIYLAYDTVGDTDYITLVDTED